MFHIFIQQQNVLKCMYALNFKMQDPQQGIKLEKDVLGEINNSNKKPKDPPAKIHKVNVGSSKTRE